MAWFKREERATNLETAFLPTTTTNVHTWAGQDVSPDAALRLSSVWACVRLLTDTISSMPVDVYRVGTLDPLPTPAVIASPAAGKPLHEWLAEALNSLLLRGNAYGLITARSGATLLPSQVEMLHPDLVSAVRTGDGRVEWRVGGTVVDKSELLHIRAHPRPGYPLGLSPVEYAAQTIGLGLAVEKFGAQFFADGCQPSGILKTDQQLDPGKARTLQQSWIASRQNNRLPAVLSGDLSYTSVSIAPEESQFIESRRLTVSDVARVFGVPPEMIGGEAGGSLTYANVEQRSLDFLTYCVSPWLVRLEYALASLLPKNQYVKFNAGALLRADTKHRYEAHAIALTAGFLTVDEVRAIEDLPPLGGVAPVDLEGTGALA